MSLHPSDMWFPCLHPPIVQHQPQDKVWAPNTIHQTSHNLASPSLFSIFSFYFLTCTLYTNNTELHQFPAHILCCFFPLLSLSPPPACPKSHPLLTNASPAESCFCSCLPIHFLGIATLLSFSHIEKTFYVYTDRSWYFPERKFSNFLAKFSQLITQHTLTHSLHFHRRLNGKREQAEAPLLTL